MLAKDVIKSARYMISDTGSTRWTDERLLVLLNEGLADVAKKTILFTETVFVKLLDRMVDFDLSSLATKLTRVEYLDAPLPLRTFEEMDRECPGWQFEKGTKPKAIIYNHLNQAQFKVYPIVENAQNENVVFSGQFGIITFVSYSDIQPVLVPGLNFGDMGAIDASGYLKVYYTRKHPKVVDTNQEVELDDVLKETLAHYVAGRALRDNADTQNRAVGNEELQFYFQGIEDWTDEKAKGFVRTVRVTPYITGLS